MSTMINKLVAMKNGTTGRITAIHAEVEVDGQRKFRKLSSEDMAALAGEATTEAAASITVTTPSWSINERFDFMVEMVNMVLNAVSNSVVITGPGGLGKTSTVLRAIEAQGLEFTKLSGYSTPRGLYEFLFRNNGNLIVIDDCDAVFNTEVGVNVLKAALDSYDERVVSWQGRETSTQDEDGAIPRSFEFTGRVIFISNWDASDIPQPIRSRALNIDLSMTVQERIDRIEALLPALAQNVNIHMSSAREAFALLVDNKGLCKDINLRTMLNLLRIRKTSGNWESLAKFSLANN